MSTKIEARTGSISFTKEGIIIDFTRKNYRDMAYIVGCEKTGENEITVTYRKRRWIHVNHERDDMYGYMFSDADPYDQHTVVQALPEYVETVDWPTKKNWFGRPTQFTKIKRLKEGWVELTCGLTTTIVSTMYTIIDQPHLKSNE